ncbi:TonB-dependent receptor domain-containing protein [Methylotenera versatilis]|uniref:TonB-dependent receptor domain-containing protein n=1 Tax=Methylotenera versatilis TaxID=1055487 RepID=UPI0006488D0D|nr:TonB-dependent receptor [Methylotenera versatilis]
MQSFNFRQTSTFRVNKTHHLISLALLTFCINAYAEPLNTSLPITIDLPMQPLAESLKQFSKKSGFNIAVDSELVKDKMAPAVKGNYESNEALKKILNDSGLEANMEGTTAIIKRERVAPTKTEAIQLDQVQVRAKRFYEIGPLPGLGLTKEQIPGNVQSITAKEIKESHSLSITDLMNKKLQSVTVNDYQGNPFQMDVQYRGFTAGPQIGTPQGLSVFFDGIRVNEPFGDVVNWDMIPMNALASVDVFPGSNPIFGLNTLGGAFTVKTKDGFNHEGFDAEVLSGSFGRKQLQVEGGWNNGTVALFGAGNLFLEDGWRDNSPSKVNQFFGKASYRGDKLDLSFSSLIVGTDLTGNGLLPSEEYARDPTSVFTGPDETKNRLQQFQLSSSYFVNDNFTITGQVYRRNSDRKQVGADVFTDYGEELETMPRTLGAGERTCLFASTGPNKGVPDYYVIPIAADANGNADISTSAFYDDLLNNYSSDPNYPDGRIYIDPAAYQGFKNAFLPNAYVTNILQWISHGKNYKETSNYNRAAIEPPSTGPALLDSAGNPVLDNSGIPIPTYSGGLFFLEQLPVDMPGSNILLATVDPLYYYSFADDNTFTTNGFQIPPGTLVKNFVVLQAPTNNEACAAGAAAINQYKADLGMNQYVDGIYGGFDPVTGKSYPGIVEGTPTAIFNNNKITQIVDGASIQFNWNLEKHKFMVGASIDAASAEYKNTSQLGFLTIDREAYLDPAQAHPMFAGAFQTISNNDFSGTNTTKSIYFSETWTPVDNWNFSASGRYNETKTKNKIAARYGIAAFAIGDVISYPDDYNVCDGDCSTNKPPTYIRPSNLFNALNKAETEKFSFNSFNPSLGATWQAKESLNIFANWAKGTRTPSVIELGCAFDRTPVFTRFSDPDGDGVVDTPNFMPKSILENRQCTLPTTLSGDPFLPQIKATTYDLGMRGTLNSFLGATDLQWNLGAYQTDLKDDIYFVAVGNGAGFFDSIGNTRRRGIEAGLSGRKDKWGFSLNYGLTDATFQDSFLMLNEDNSSSQFVNGYGNAIQVKKGNRMPGVSLHNLNASVSYEVTPKWQVGLSAVLHSDSFVRGNENNEHRKGALVPGRDNIGPVGNALLQPAGNPGTVPGYAVFNFQTSYKFNTEWTASMLVNNVFDTEYFTAGRLGRNPFSPSINGAIGPDGYNHNSSDWRSTNFISPSAPRGVWFSLNWRFDPNKK